MELVVFALPLFIPVILLATHLTTVSASKIELAHLARTSLRAFASAESTPLGHARIRQVLELGEMGSNSSTASGIGQKHRFEYALECQKTPCIQPLNRLRLTLIDKAVGTEIKVTTSTDMWIESESGFVPRDPKLFFGQRDVAEVEERISPIVDAKDLIDQVSDVFEITKQ